ncbi:unnamed protein product, partial [Phaeothamnion confervicola]
FRADQGDFAAAAAIGAAIDGEVAAAAGASSNDAGPSAWSRGAAGAAAGGGSSSSGSFNRFDGGFVGGFSSYGGDVGEVRAALPTISDRLLGGGRGTALHERDEEEAQDGTDWIFPPPAGLSLPSSFAETRNLCKEQKKWLLVRADRTWLVFVVFSSFLLVGRFLSDGIWNRNEFSIDLRPAAFGC